MSCFGSNFPFVIGGVRDTSAAGVYLVRRLFCRQRVSIDMPERLIWDHVEAFLEF